MLNRAFMDKMAMKVRKRYVEHIFLKGKDVNDNKFEVRKKQFNDRHPTENMGMNIDLSKETMF